MDAVDFKHIQTLQAALANKQVYGFMLYMGQEVIL